MLTILTSEQAENYDFYQKNLSNFQTVMKDTNNNLITADEWDYNCMSYALGIYDSWLNLESFSQSFSCDSITIDYEHMEDVFYDCCSELEEVYAARRISGPEVQLEESERIIAFRVSADDFHFVRQNSDGTWTHKPGCEYIREMSEEELFSEAWSEEIRVYPYISTIAFFAVRIQETFKGGMTYKTLDR